MMRDAIEMRPALLYSPRVQLMVRFLQKDPAFIRWAFPYYPDEIAVTPLLGADAVSRIVVASLMNVWATARVIAPDGYLEGATCEEIDRIAGVPQFGAAMQRGGWLEVLVGGVLLPNFCEHNPPVDSPTGRKDSRAEPSNGVMADDGFEEFWQAYPKKTGKGAARRSWRKIRPGKNLTQTILQSVEVHKRSEQWIRDGGRYIPNPATWLNQTRWEDVPDQPVIASTERVAKTLQGQEERRAQAEALRQRSLDAARIREILQNRGRMHQRLIQQRVEDGKHE